MVSQPEYEKVIFVFNDNWTDRNTAKRGAGSASVRPWNCHGKYKDRPRCVGIPTGDSCRSGGYKALTDEVKAKIDTQIALLQRLVTEHGYTTIYYPSAGGPDGPLATQLFAVDSSVLLYIKEQLKTIV